MIAAGFANPVFDAQAAFRAVMDATARPGRIVPMAGVAERPRPLLPATASFVLSLLDHDTPVWLDDVNDDLRTWIAFHAGAPVTADPSQAAFAIVSRPQTLPAFDTFNPGTPDYPDRSTTVIVQVETLSGGAPLALEGPGIKGRERIAPSPVPADLRDRLALNRSLFPCGIDLIFVSADGIAALPRSVRVVEGG